jgi:hypothetical protein
MLDLRQHEVSGLREEGLVRAQGESMLLFDNAGFSEKDWKSLRNLHQSEKRKSPWTTGKKHRVLVRCSDDMDPVRLRWRYLFNFYLPSAVKHECRRHSSDESRATQNSV